MSQGRRGSLCHSCCLKFVFLDANNVLWVKRLMMKLWALVPKMPGMHLCLTQ